MPNENIPGHVDLLNKGPMSRFFDAGKATSADYSGQDFQNVNEQAEDGDTEEQIKYSAVISGKIKEKWLQSRNARQPSERIWLKCMQAYRGQYTPDEMAKLSEALQRNPNAATVYVKISKTKTQAAYGQLQEILFANDTFPLNVEPTEVPTGIAAEVYLEAGRGTPDTKEGLDDTEGGNPKSQSVYGYPGDGNDLPPGATTQSLLGGILEKYKKLIKGKQVNPGPSPDKTKAIQINVADEAAKEMNKVIHEQVWKTDATVKVKKGVLEMCMLGTGCIKGPFTKEVKVNSWKQDPDTELLTYAPITKNYPWVEHVSIWNLYPDPKAVNVGHCEYVIERHLLTVEEMRELMFQPTFDKDAVSRVLAAKPFYAKQYWEQQLRDAQVNVLENRYEVLEYWGYLQKEDAVAMGLLDVDDADYDLPSVQVNAWIDTRSNELLRLVLNPFTPARLPYHFFPYEEHPYQIWGIGVPENMDDVQNIMNAHMRMAIDNLKLAGSVMLEVNQSLLSPGQDSNIYAGKIWYKTGGPPNQSIYPIQVNNTAPAHMQMYDKARQLADEATGLPSYAHGQTGVSGTTRTAAGMSMLMGAANINIKTVIKNLDHYLLTPLGEGFFNWNMQFNSDNKSIRGDMNIVATGVASLMQKEVRTQRLLQFVQVSSNPNFAHFMNAPYVYGEIANSLDLDADKAVNDPQEAALYAAMMQGMQANASNQQGTGPQPQAPNVGPPSSDGTGQSAGAINPQDTSGGGGGNIGTGTPPQAGEAGFTG